MSVGHARHSDEYLDKGQANEVSAVNLKKLVDNIGNSFSVYSAGTSYTFTDEVALLDFGTTDPSLTIAKPGTYLLLSRIKINFNKAGFPGTKTVSFKLRRTNNTELDIPNASCDIILDVFISTYSLAESFTMHPIIYTTENSDDVIEMWGGLDSLPNSGSIECDCASIVAIRLY